MLRIVSRFVDDMGIGMRDVPPMQAMSAGIVSEREIVPSAAVFSLEVMLT